MAQSVRRQTFYPDLRTCPTEEIISSAGRPPVVIQPKENGAFWLHAPKTIVALDADEAERLAAFVRNEPRLVSYPVTTPAKARFSTADD
ncbi:MAG: hypothetical protein WCF69_27485 [Mycobacterium sp.]